MKEKDYVRICNFFRKYSWGERLVIEINKWVTYVFYAIFVVTLCVMVWHRDDRLLRVVLTAAIPFVIVTVFRKLYNSPRPYKVYEFEPLVKKEKQGESMPSRHVFSAYVISMALLYLCPWLGIVMLVLATIIAVGRVIGGVHFPKDVVVGALIGIFSGIIGFYII